MRTHLPNTLMLSPMAEIACKRLTAPATAAATIVVAASGLHREDWVWILCPGTDTSPAYHLAKTHPHLAHCRITTASQPGAIAAELSRQLMNAVSDGA